jgi:hypothetical protein
MNGSCSDCGDSFWCILMPLCLSASLVHAFSAKLNTKSVETLDCRSKRSRASLYRLESISFFMVGDNETFDKHLDFDWTKWQTRRMSMIYKRQIQRDRQKRQDEFGKAIDMRMKSDFDCVSYGKCSDAKRQVTHCVFTEYLGKTNDTQFNFHGWQSEGIACNSTRFLMKVSREGARCQCAKW